MRSFPLAVLVLTVLASSALVPSTAQAQTAPRRYVRADAGVALPTFGLRTRFGPAATGALAYGWALDGGRSLELRVSARRFGKGTLALDADTSGVGVGPIDPDSIDVSLSLAGGAVRFQQQVGAFGRVVPRVTVGAGFTHWVDRRGAYASRGLPEAQRRRQWSGEVQAGLGADVALTPRFALALDAVYHLLPGDLVRTQRVRLQPVSSFQFATLAAGLKVGL